MEDTEIVGLYLDRDEAALEATDKKYRRYCWAIACNILGNAEDAAECVNDVWLAAWNSIPPHRPEKLGPYLGKLTRRAALKKWRAERTIKRGGGQVPLALEELAECLPDAARVDDRLLAEAMAAGINGFLAELSPVCRQAFVRRYWALEPLETISLELGCSKSKVASMLHRARIKLRDHLLKEELL